MNRLRLILLSLTLVTITAGVRVYAGPAPGAGRATASASGVDGVVITPDGKPCAGAHVLLIDGPEDEDPPYVTSDAQGRFHFSGKAIWATHGTPDMAWVLAKAYGFGLAGEHVKVGTDLTLTLTPASSLHAQFVDDSGQPIAGAHISLEALVKDTSHEYWYFPKAVGDHLGGVTSSDGSVVVPDMPQGFTVRLQVDDERYARLRDRASRIAISSSATTQADPITLEPGSTIEGRVTFESGGKPVAGVMVSARDFSGDSPMRLSAVTGADGHYRIQQLPSGRFEMRATLSPPLSDEWTSAGMAPQVLQSDYHVLDADATLVSGGLISGQVTFTGTTKPVANTVVTANGKSNTFAGTVTDNHGRYRMRMPAGLTQINVQVADVPPLHRQVTVAAGQVTTLDFSTDEPSLVSVHGLVVDAAGNPIPGAVVSGSTVLGSSTGATTSQTDADGKFTVSLSGIGGLLLLTARHGDSGTLAPVGVVAGDDVTLHLSDKIMGRIMGVVLDRAGLPIPSADVTLTQWAGRAKSPGGSVKTDDQGIFQFTGLEPFPHYSVAASAAGFSTVSNDRILIQSGKTTDLPPLMLLKADSFVTGHVFGADGQPLANAVVSTAGGLNSTTTDPLGAFRLAGVARGPVTLSVSSGDESASQLVAAGTDVAIRTQSTAAVTRLTVAQRHVNSVDLAPQPAPEFAVAGWVNSSPVTLSSMHDKFVLVDVCACCTDKLPDLQALVKEFGGYGVAGVGIRVPDSSVAPEDIRSHVSDEGVTIPVAVDQFSREPGQIGETAAGLGAKTTESFLLIDRSGRVILNTLDFVSAVEKLGQLLMDEQKAKQPGTSVPAASVKA